jgi:hypothetical protein
VAAAVVVVIVVVLVSAAAPGRGGKAAASKSKAGALTCTLGRFSLVALLVDIASLSRLFPLFLDFALRIRAAEFGPFVETAAAGAAAAESRNGTNSVLFRLMAA